MNITDIEINRCFGCSACMAVCSKNAISMRENNEGFLYPIVNKEQCNDCGICVKTCIVNKKSNLKNEHNFYAAIDRNTDSRCKSQSGGIFSLIAKLFLQSHHLVYGCMLGKDYTVYHGCVDNINDLDKLRGSKYVQSDMKNCYQEVRHHLREGRTVLFSGTACQIDGLKSFLAGRYDNLLFTIDIVCYGVPSPKIWREYVNNVKEIINEDIKKIDFRSKNLYGWYSACESYQFKDQILFSKSFLDIYFNNCALRKSCYECKYTNLDRVGDITLGDCWGIEQKFNHIDKDNGVSLVIVNTEKGRSCLEQIKSNVEMYNLVISDCFQPRLEKPSNVEDHVRRNFWNQYTSSNDYFFRNNYFVRDLVIDPVSYQNIVLWGTGKRFDLSIEYVKNIYNIKYVCDSNSEKWGKEISGVRVISPEFLNQLEDVFVLIMVDSIDAILQIGYQLNRIGITSLDYYYHWHKMQISK